VPRLVLIVGFACFITNQIHAELIESTDRKLRLEEKDDNFEKMLHFFPEGVAFFDKDQKSLYSNPYWKSVGDEVKMSLNNISISSIDLENLLKDDSKTDLLDILVKKEDSKKSLRKVVETLSAKHLNRPASKNESSDDSLFHDSCIINPDESEFVICSQNGKCLKEYAVKIVNVNYFDGRKSLLLLLNDVTDRLRLRDEKISGKIKSMMLWSVSHELRTPLNQINGMLYLAKSKCENNKIKSYLEIAENWSELLLFKINDILDYCEIKNKSFKIKKNSFSIHDFMKSLREIFEKSVDNKVKRLLIFISRDTPEFITQDERRIKQILWNIVYNAIKYTEKGFIIISVDWEKGDSQSLTNFNDHKNKNKEKFLRIQVSDSGIGIPKEKRENIYKIFGDDLSQPDVQNEINGSTKLAGLGLSISQLILKQFKSKLYHKSNINVGSKFWFKLQVDEFKYDCPIMNKGETPSINFNWQRGFNNKDMKIQRNKSCDKFLKIVDTKNSYIKQTKITNKRDSSVDKNLFIGYDKYFSSINNSDIRILNKMKNNLLEQEENIPDEIHENGKPQVIKNLNNFKNNDLNTKRNIKKLKFLSQRELMICSNLNNNGTVQNSIAERQISSQKQIEESKYEEIHSRNSEDEDDFQNWQLSLSVSIN
jgi:signal transduction histidine kinase